MEQGLCLVCGIIAVYQVPLERGLYFLANQGKLARYHCGIVNALPWNKDLALSVHLAGGLNYSLANQNKLALYHPVSSNYPM